MDTNAGTTKDEGTKARATKAMDTNAGTTKDEGTNSGAANDEDTNEEDTKATNAMPESRSLLELLLLRLKA